MVEKSERCGFSGLTILLHGWPDTKSLTIDISSPRPHHKGRTVSREQHCMMDFNKPDMTVSFPSLSIRKLSVLEARLPSLKNSKMASSRCEQSTRKANSACPEGHHHIWHQHQRLKRSGCGSRRKFLWGRMFLIVAFPHDGGKSTIMGTFMDQTYKRNLARGAVRSRHFLLESDDEVMFALGQHDLIEAETQVFFR